MKNSVLKLKLILFTAIILPLFIVQVSASAEAETLLNLDLGGFTAGSPDRTGIINTGSSDTAKIHIGNSANVKVTKTDMVNIHQQRVSYLNKRHSMYNWVAISSYMNIADTQWEKEAVTFSYWADLNTVTDNDAGKSVAEYRIEYKDGDSTGYASVLLCQLNYEYQTNYAWNVGYNNITPIDMSESKGWTHVAMTNPQCGSDGSKTLDIYINGVYKKSKAITIPSDAEITDAKLIFGGMADNTMVPTDASYGGIQVYRGTLTAAEISALYNSQKDMFTPMEGKISLEVYGKDGTVQDGYINYPDLSDGMEAKLCIDNPNGGSDINARLYSAVKDGTGLKEAYVSEPITVEDGELGYAENFDFDDIFSALTPGDEVSFYLWTDELTPLTEEKSFYIKNMLFNETDGCRLIIHTNVIPRAESLVPEAFTITDPAEAYTADRVIYYPLTNEIHIIIDDAKGISLPCRVRARLKDRSGTPFNLDVKAEISSLYDIPVYSDGIKYLSVTKDGSAAGSVITESGNYTIETGAVIQQRDRTAPAQIVVYKQSGETTAKIAGKSVSCTDDDVVFTVSCRLKAGDRVYAVIE